MVGFYAVAAIVCTFPLVLHLADALSPAPDTLLHSWILAWDIHALTTDPLHLYDANVYFPFPLSLAYSDAMLSGALMVAPVLLLTGNPVLAHNVLTLAALLVAALGVYVLVRALTGSGVGGLVGGCIFAFCASRQAHLEHVNLLQFGWLPFALLYLHRSMARGRTSDLLLFAFLTVCQALASVYLAWMMAIAYALFFAIELSFGRAAGKRGNLVRVVGALVLAALVVIPVMWPYEQMQQLYEFHWPTDVIGDLSAVPADYLSVPPQNLLYTQLLSRFAPSHFPTEHELFPGFVALILASIAVVRRSMNVDVLRYSLIGSAGFVLSFGPFVHLGSQTVATPYFYLLQLVPGFGVMRVPARFDFLVMLALGVVAGFGVARVSAALARWSGLRTRQSILVGIVVFTLLELVPRPQSIVPISVGADVPPVYGWLRTQDPRAVVAEIPAQGPTGYASFGYEYLSAYHWHPLVNGSSGFEPPAAGRIANELDAFPDPTAVANLRSLGVRFLIAHLDALDQVEAQRLRNADLSRLQLGIAATFGPDVVYELAPSPTPSTLRDHVHLELPSIVGRGRAPSVSVTIANDAPDPLFVGAPEAVGAQVEWNHEGVTDHARQDLPVFIQPDHTVALLFPAELSARVAAADSAQLRVRLTGSVQLEATQTVRIVDLPTSVERTTLSATLENVQLPRLVHAQSVIPVEVTARNTGHSIWLPDPPGTSGTRGVVGVSVRGWTGPDGSVVPPSENSTAHVRWNVNPGQAAVLTLQTSTPPAAGHYQLVLDMLSENVTWFADVDGGAQSVVPVDVEP